MPKILNFKNVEDLVFQNKQIKDALPHLNHIFENWLFGYQFIAAKFVRKQAVYDLLRYLSADDLKIISNILKEELVLSSDISRTIINIQSNICSLEKDLPFDFNYIDLSIYRKGEDIGVTLWK
jgi:hypothetical protein